MNESERQDLEDILTSFNNPRGCRVDKIQEFLSQVQTKMRSGKHEAEHDWTIHHALLDMHYGVQNPLFSHYHTHAYIVCNPEAPRQLRLASLECLNFCMYVLVAVLEPWRARFMAKADAFKQFETVRAHLPHVYTQSVSDYYSWLKNSIDFDMRVHDLKDEKGQTICQRLETFRDYLARLDKPVMSPVWALVLTESMIAIINEDKAKKSQLVHPAYILRRFLNKGDMSPFQLTRDVFSWLRHTKCPPEEYATLTNLVTLLLQTCETKTRDAEQQWRYKIARTVLLHFRTLIQDSARA